MMHMCKAKVGLWDDKLTNSYEVEQLKLGFASNLCGILVVSAVITVGAMGRIPLLIVSNMKQTVTLRRGCSIARLNQVASVNIISPSEVKQHHIEEGELVQVNMPEEFRVVIHKLLNLDLRRTDMVKMCINTDGHVPIKMPISHTSHTKKASR